MNIGDLYASTLSAASTATDFIIVSPDNYLGFTPDIIGFTNISSGFKFQIIAEETASLQSDITDHYIESNTALQDHISLKPITVTVSGFVGELNNVVPTQLIPVKEAVDRLGILSAYIPSVTNTALRAYNIAAQMYALIEKIKKAVSVSAGVTLETEQQKAYRTIEKYRNDRVLFWVQTPFKQYENMAIQSIQITQSENDKNTTDFSITFKEIKYANSQRLLKVPSDRINDKVDNRGDC